MPPYRQTTLQKNLRLRAQAIQAIRSFLIDDNYLEVETPCRIPTPAIEAHLEAEAAGSWFLHASPELCMKRLLAAGYPRLFQICKCFRKAERGAKHLPEFTMLEWYSAGQNYLDMMEHCEQLIQSVLRDLAISASFVYQGIEIKLKQPWPRVSVSSAFDKYASISMPEALRTNRFDETMIEEVEPRLGFDPLFLYDYPAQRGSLARLKPEDPSLAERFELYIGGLELCNAFSELTDPFEQRRRFAQEQDRRKLHGQAVLAMPEKFLSALADMPQAAGNALGIDRLVMLVTDAAAIDEVVAFTPEEL